MDLFLVKCNDFFFYLNMYIEYICNDKENLVVFNFNKFKFRNFQILVIEFFLENRERKTFFCLDQYFSVNLKLNLGKEVWFIEGNKLIYFKYCVFNGVRDRFQ